MEGAVLQRVATLFSSVATRYPGVHWVCGVDRIAIVKGEKEIQESLVSNA